MAKKETGLKSTLSSLGAKVPVRQASIDLEKTQNAINNIHTEKKDEKKVRQTVDLSEDTFKKFKVKLAIEGRKAQQVLNELVERYVNQ